MTFQPDLPPAQPDEIDLLQIGRALRRHWIQLVAGPCLAAGLGYAASFLVTPVFTAKTTLLPPQQPQSVAASALSSLGALAGLAGASQRTPADQYIALLQSTTVTDRIIERFDLQDIYQNKLRSQTRQQLASNVRITVGKKDGLLNIEVEDTDPQRATDMANRYVEELRRISSDLAVTEAQQRRAFFEQQLAKAKQRLTESQTALQATGFNAGDLKSEPKAAAEAYAKLKAESTAAEIKLQTLRAGLSDTAPEVQMAQTKLAAIRAQLERLESSEAQRHGNVDAAYVSRYRDFKYEEALFELLARQFELAKVDEAREGALIQVVDSALLPDQKSRPRRSLFALGAAVLAWLVIMARIWRAATQSR